MINRRKLCQMVGAIIGMATTPSIVLAAIPVGKRQQAFNMLDDLEKSYHSGGATPAWINQGNDWMGFILNNFPMPPIEISIAEIHKKFYGAGFENGAKTGKDWKQFVKDQLGEQAVEEHHQIYYTPNEIKYAEISDVMFPLFIMRDALARRSLPFHPQNQPNWQIFSERSQFLVIL